MLTVTRERIRERLRALLPVMDTCARGDPTCYDEALRWLSETQEVLKQVRCAEAGLMGTLRAKLSAARDGFRDPAIPGSMTPRKALRATAAVYLGQAEAALREQAAALSGKLDPMKDQMAQLLAVSQLVAPFPALPPGGVDQGWLEHVWATLPQIDQTRLVRSHLNTALAQVDRLYLLDELLANLPSPASEPGGAALRS